MAGRRGRGREVGGTRRPFRIQGIGADGRRGVATLAAFDPIQNVEKNPEPLRGLRALYLDCGTSDRTDVLGESRIRVAK